MVKIMFFVLAAVITVQSVLAFKIVNVNLQGAAPASTAVSQPTQTSTASTYNFDKSAFIRSYNNAVNAKLRSLGTIVAQLLQAKQTFHNSLLSAASSATTQSADSSPAVSSSPNSIPIYTKTINVSYKTVGGVSSNGSGSGSSTSTTSTI